MNDFYNNVQGLTFKDVDDLYARKMQIREKFATLDYQTKEIYKWFFYYELCMLKNPLKRLLWDFICGSKELSMQLELPKEYRKFCEKRKRIYPNFCDDFKFDNYD
jgi:hypothetical protein